MCYGSIYLCIYYQVSCNHLYLWTLLIWFKFFNLLEYSCSLYSLINHLVSVTVSFFTFYFVNFIVSLCFLFKSNHRCVNIFQKINIWFHLFFHLFLFHWFLYNLSIVCLCILWAQFVFSASFLNWNIWFLSLDLSSFLKRYWKLVLFSALFKLHSTNPGIVMVSFSFGF